MRKRVRIVTINPSSSIGMGKIKVFMPPIVESIDSTINPDIVTVRLTSEVYSLYEGRANRDKTGWTLQKEYIRKLGIPEKYINWSIYPPEIRKASDNIPRFILNRLNIKEGDFINGAYIDRIKQKTRTFEGQPQVIVFSTEKGKHKIKNDSEIDVFDENTLRYFLSSDFDFEEISIEEIYYPRYVLKFENQPSEDDDVKHSKEVEELWIEDMLMI